MREALTERGLLLDRLAPHLVRPVPFLLPASGGVERSYMGAGVALYDMLSRIGAYGGTMPRPRTLSSAAVHGLAPGLRVDAMEGAVRFHDAQIDDARHTVALARTAVARGAAVATGVRVVDLVREAGVPPHDESSAAPECRWRRAARRGHRRGVRRARPGRPVGRRRLDR